MTAAKNTILLGYNCCLVGGGNFKYSVNVELKIN